MWKNKAFHTEGFVLYSQLFHPRWEAHSGAIRDVHPVEAATAANGAEVAKHPDWRLDRGSFGRSDRGRWPKPHRPGNQTRAEPS